MKKIKFITDAYCGLYCGACPLFLSTKNNVDSEKQARACHGCKSEQVGPG